MARFFTFGPASSLSPVSADVSVSRSLGLAVALVRRRALPALSLDLDAPLRGGGLMLSLSFSAPGSEWVRAQLSFLLPPPVRPVFLAAHWVWTFRSRVVDARRDPFFPAPTWWEAFKCALTSSSVY